MTKAGAVLATLGLGFVLAGCTSGSRATASGPSAKEIAACAPIVNVKLPPVRPGMGLAIALPTKQVESLIKSGNPTLARNGRIFTEPQSARPPRSGNVYVNALVNAQAECRQIGVR
jgi:hypothetical protein